MNKVKIRIVLLGHLPHSIETEKFLKWKSVLFVISSPIKSISIDLNSDGDYWEFSDDKLEKIIPKRGQEDILLAVTNITLESNYYVRRISDNRVCLSYRDMIEILSSENIPLVNLLFRLLYSISIVYRRTGNRIPLMAEKTYFTHDETRGCIFDMNGIKNDIVYSLNKPIICSNCIDDITLESRYKIDKVEILKVQNELNKIQKSTYYRIIDIVKKYPKIAFLISSAFAIILGILGSLIAAYIWERI